MPCRHEYAEPARDGVGVIAPATLIECYTKRSSEGFYDFTMQLIAFVPNGGRMEKKRLSMCFDAESYYKEAVEAEFLRFLGRHSTYLNEWPTWGLPGWKAL